ncbi:Rik1-associated factor 1 [Paraphoma chrysanthemicola]|uniref:Rik1-associated factor 1 n=1 Tax=Paraphoma chrysanthemicola TaxID=798071 RepID=A0A8K0R904_9PLEO|nr:Rik1-associated factor 1 [Paraphoma chrysanthemicola]
MMSLSDWRSNIVDLTLDDESDSEDDLYSMPAPVPTSSKVQTTLPTIPTPVPRPTSTHAPQPSSASHVTSSQNRTLNKPTPCGSIAAANSRAQSSTQNAASIESNSTIRQNYVHLTTNAADSANDYGDDGHAGKRRKLAQFGLSTKTPQPASGRGGGLSSTSSNGSQQKHTGSAFARRDATAAHAQPGPAPSRLTTKSSSLHMLNKAPSVQQMNAALKAGSASSPLVEQVAYSTPRPIQISRIPSRGDTHSSRSLGSPATTTSKTTAGAHSYTKYGETQRTQYRAHGGQSGATSAQATRTPPQAERFVPVVFENRMREQATAMHERQVGPSAFTHTNNASRKEDKDSVMSDASSIPDTMQAAHPSQGRQDNRLPPSVPISQSAARNATLSKSAVAFTEEEEHLLIFLKEVKKYKWTLITSEFNKDYPGRPYTALQSRYSTKTNRRDRSQDPQVLNLPPRWAAESAIDWTSAHADNPGPREKVEAMNQHYGARPTTGGAAKPAFMHHSTEQGYSSGNDSGSRQHRPRRAPPVNYDVRRRNRRLAENVEENDVDDVMPVNSATADITMRSESPTAQLPVPVTSHIVVSEPLEMQFDADNARIGLLVREGITGRQSLPYLASAQRLTLRNSPDDWMWDQSSSRDWQGSLVHVDFSSDELEQVLQAVTKIQNAPQQSRHKTQRRHFRAILKKMSEPKLMNLRQALRRRLVSRDSKSIQAFLQDAIAGNITDAPQILRLTAARLRKPHSSGACDSTTTMLRLRENGLQSKRGWKAAVRALTYSSRNKLTDTLGPLCSWTGASSDIHTVAWSPGGESFAAGAVAVTDVDSMQYNRRNNLLFGDLRRTSIHELAEHTVPRPRTETGANSTHAMFVSQDPKLYTTVTSVGFSPSGKVMYSAGYDESICVWHMEADGLQPALGAKLRHKAEVEMMIVNRRFDGMLATAAKTTGGNAIKLLTIDEDDPANFTKHSFRSEKAASRADLRILPQAVQFEPRFGELLLAGFGANARADSGFDLTGDLCLWDIETQTSIPIYGSNRNVFDVTFNPNRRTMPLFAAGCVANGNVNRGTRSVIRLYDEKAADRYTCASEIECKALDINDVVWCPEDEQLIAAGCTDGRVYVWDMRRPDHPLRTLAHGPSLMPLQDGIHHERTDTGIRFLSWGDTSTRLYSGSSDGVVKVWDVTRSEEETFVKDLITLDSGIMAGAFTSDHSRLLLGEVNGSVNVLDVGRDDCTLKDAEKLRYIPYAGADYEDDLVSGEPSVEEDVVDSGVTASMQLLQSQQLQVVPMGTFPVWQVVQGPYYRGPFDQGVDAPFLRQQALELQLSMKSPQQAQCSIPACRDNMTLVTSEEIGDSGRSADRIPDQLRRQWTALDTAARIIPGKSRCIHCARPARPSSSTDEDSPVLCERCSFACLRCGADNPIAPATTTLICDTCAGVWDIGALGFECVEEPIANAKLNVPALRRFGRDMLEEKMENEAASFGDEMNALTDYYFSLAIDRPESPPL